MHWTLGRRIDVAADETYRDQFHAFPRGTTSGGMLGFLIKRADDRTGTGDAFR
jgi:hypothetical protein